MAMTKRPPMVAPSLARARKLEEKHGNPLYAPIHQALQELLDPENKNSLNFWVSLRRELQRYSFEEHLAFSIINEAYERARRALDNSKKIPNPMAWLRLTARNIIKEMARLRRNETPTDVIEEYSSFATQTDIDDEITYAQHKQVDVSKDLPLTELSPLEKAIIELKVTQKLKWLDVQAALIALGFGHFSLAALRQRKSRILQKLKRAL